VTFVDSKISSWLKRGLAKKIKKTVLMTDEKREV